MYTKAFAKAGLSPAITSMGKVGRFAAGVGLVTGFFDGSAGMVMVELSPFLVDVGVGV